MHTVVIGLGYGDEGKGSIVDWLCSPKGEHSISAVIRFNGGHQAAHNVVQPDGRHHTFSQFGSGTFHGVPTYLSKYMVIDPLSMITERKHLESLGLNPQVWISPHCLITTPYHIFANKKAEEKNSHGTCGVGFGETVKFDLDYPYLGLRVWDLVISKEYAVKCLARIKNILNKDSEYEEGLLMDRYREFTQLPWVHIMEHDSLDKILDSGPCVFEGAQGVLLDENYGMHPHTTWSTITSKNADKILGNREARRLGVLRSYATRHGAGPFPTEDSTLNIPEAHNGDGTQGSFRQGHFDLVATRYAIEVQEKFNPLDCLAITHTDWIRAAPKICTGYIVDGKPWVPEAKFEIAQKVGNISVPAVVEEWQKASPDYSIGSKKNQDELGIPGLVGSFGPTYQQKFIHTDSLTKV